MRARLVEISEIPHLKNNVILKLNQKYWNSFFSQKVAKYSNLRAILKDEASRGKEYEVITLELWKNITQIWKYDIEIRRLLRTPDLDDKDLIRINLGMILTDNIQFSDHRLLYGWQDMTLQEVYEAIEYVIEKKYASVNIKRFKFWRLQKRLAYRNLMIHINECIDSFNNNASSGSKKIKFPGLQLQEALTTEYRSLKFKQRDIMILEIIGDKSAFEFTENDDELDEEPPISSLLRPVKVEKKRKEKRSYHRIRAEKESNQASDEEQSEDDDQEYKASRSIRNKKPSPLGSGLNNLGNSCYMNASIQCLFHTKPFANYITDEESNDPSTDELIMRLTSRARQRIDNLGDEFKQLRLLPKFHEVMRELKEQKKQAISPLLFKRTAGLFDPQFSGNKQCDAQEFICFLLNQLNDELSRRQNNSKEESKRDGNNGSNAVARNFHGQLLSRIECSECNHFSSRKDPFLSLSLPVLQKRSFIMLQLFKLGCAIPRTIEIQYNFTQDNIGDLDLFLKMHFQIEGGLVYFEFNDGYLLQQLTNSKSLRVVHHESEILAFIIPEEVAYHFAVNQEENNLLAGIVQESDHSAFFIEFKHKGKLQTYPTLCMSNHLEVEHQFNTENKLFEEIGKDLLRTSWDDSINCTYKSSRNVQKACIGNPIKIHRIDTDAKVELFKKIREEVDVEQLRISACELHRAVSVVQSDDSSLNDCFINFCRMEQLDQENLWTCQKCNKSIRAIKSIELDQVPPFLILHLKRFTSTRRKIERPIRFPLRDMNLQLSNGEVVKYDLYGIINHYGTLDRGHYTAMCKVGERRPKDEDDQDEGKWALFNDNSVQSIESDQINKKSAYVLFYERKA